MRLSSEKLLLWIGEQDNPIKINRLKDNVTDSVINYYGQQKPKLSYKPGRLLLDSGAFTATMRGLKLSRERVIAIQERFNPDLAIPLDYPFKPGMTVREMRYAWKKTKENMLFWQNNTTLSGRILPTLHSWSKKALQQNIQWIYKHIDAEYIALGVVVDKFFMNFRGFFRDRQPSLSIIRNLYNAISIIKRTTDFKIHVMGMGSSPLMLHITYYLGADSMDTIGWRRKAAFGKIILPERGERYICDRAGNFSRRRPTIHELKILSECDCEICRVNPTLLFTDWRARAIHNEFVIKREAEKARQLLNIGRDAYEEYLDRVFAKSKYGLQYLWKYVKLLVKYPPLTVR